MCTDWAVFGGLLGMIQNGTIDTIATYWGMTVNRQKGLEYV